MTLTDLERWAMDNRGAFVRTGSSFMIPQPQPKEHAYRDVDYLLPPYPLLPVTPPWSATEYRELLCELRVKNGIRNGIPGYGSSSMTSTKIKEGAHTHNFLLFTDGDMYLQYRYATQAVRHEAHGEQAHRVITRCYGLRARRSLVRKTARIKRFDMHRDVWNKNTPILIGPFTRPSVEYGYGEDSAAPFLGLASYLDTWFDEDKPAVLIDPGLSGGCVHNSSLRMESLVLRSAGTGPETNTTIVVCVAQNSAPRLVERADVVPLILPLPSGATLLVLEFHRSSSLQSLLHLHQSCQPEHRLGLA